MIQAQRVEGSDGRQWIKIQFKPNQVYQSILRRMRAIWIPHAQAWALPYEKRAEFEQRLGDYLIVWTDEAGDGSGGIDENTIPSKPIVEGYDVEYDAEGNIVSSTGFKTPPFGEFQVKGFNALVSRKFLILADEAGLGKSFQTATAIEALKKQGKVKHGLVVAKATLLYNWRDEIHKHTYERAVIAQGTAKQRYKLYAELAHRDDWTFLIISYEMFRQDVSNLQLLDNWKSLDFLIADEAHKIKNPRSHIGTAIHYLPFKYRYILTATPLPNSPLEAYNYLRLGRAIDMNWFEFENRYAVKGGYGGKDYVGFKNIRELKAIIQGNMLRRRKADKLKELPAVVSKTIPVLMTPLQERVYKAVREEVMEELAETNLTSIPNTFAKLLRLQQAANSLDLLGMPPSSKNSAKLDTLDDLLQSLIDEGGQKVIVYSRFRSMVDIMQERYKKYNPAVVHGEVNNQGKSKQTVMREIAQKYNIATLSTEELERLIEKHTASERQQQVYKFQEDSSCKLFIGSAPACREGLTLTAATHVIFIDCEWSPAYVEQAYSRAHRIGQKDALTVYYLVCMGTIDEKVQEVLSRKDGMAQEMLDKGIDAYNIMQARELIHFMAG